MSMEGATRRRSQQRDVVQLYVDRQQVDDLIATLKETNTHLKGISMVASDTLQTVRGFGSKWLPWIIASVGVLWPVAGKIISGLPPLPG